MERRKKSLTFSLWNYLALILISSSPLINSFENSDGGIVNSGIYHEELASPVFYESFIPFVLEYQSQLWNKTELTFNNWYNCTSEQAPYTLSCPIAFNMNKAILNLHIDFDDLQPVQDEEILGMRNRGSSNKNLKSTQNSQDFCQLIEKHFGNGNEWINPKDLDSYILKLQSCTFGFLYGKTIRSIPNYNYSIRGHFSKMEVNFYKTFYMPILEHSQSNPNHSSIIVPSAVLSNSRTALQGSLLGTFYAQKQRWTQASTDCSLQKIPHSIIPHSLLSEFLTNVTRSIQTNNQISGPKISLSIPKGRLSKYFSIPITDCAYTKDHFTVRILIPIKVKANDNEIEKKLVKVTPVPFIYKKKICQLEIKSDYYIQEVVNQSVESSLSYITNCRSDQLCKGDYTSKMENFDSCVTAVLSKNLTETRRNCQFKCWPFQEFKRYFPIVNRVASDKLVLTGQGKFDVVCNDETGLNTKSYVIHEDQVGAVEVKLPCSCQINIPSSGKVYTSEEPCSKNWHYLTVEEVYPIHFLNEFFDEYDYTDNDGFIDITSGFTVDEEQADYYTSRAMDNSWRKHYSEEGEHFDMDHEMEGPSLSNKLYSREWIVFCATVTLLFLIQGYIIWEIIRIRKTQIRSDTITYRQAESPLLN